MDQPDVAPALPDGVDQPRDESDMHVARIAAGAVLQHAETVHDDVGLPRLDQLGKLKRRHRHDRQFDILALRSGRKAARDTNDPKATATQIRSEVLADQAGRAEHQGCARG